MFRWQIHKSEDTPDSICKLKEAFDHADAIIIGAGAGLSTSAGLSYSGERFHKYFHDFAEKYPIQDIYSGGFYPFDTLEEYWAWWSRQVYYNRYVDHLDLYQKLFQLVKDKDYFVLTTNVDHCFQKANFDKQRLFYKQGDYGLFQCSSPCHQETYDNEELIKKMIEQQKDMKIPTSLIPYCPHCGKPMTMNLRCDDTFVEDEGWHQAYFRYQDFIRRHQDLKIVYLELGVGQNTPGIIKYPFFRFVERNKNATYICINKDTYCPQSMEKRAYCISEDIKKVIDDLLKIKLEKQYIYTAFNQLVINPEDPLKYGFQLKK